jgi:hypothetical protein
LFERHRLKTKEETMNGIQELTDTITEKHNIILTARRSRADKLQKINNIFYYSIVILEDIKKKQEKVTESLQKICDVLPEL